MQLNIGKKARETLEVGKNLLRSRRLIYQLLTQVRDLLLSPYRMVQAYMICGSPRGTSFMTTTLFIGSKSSSQQFAMAMYSQPFEITPKSKFLFRYTTLFSNATAAEVVAIRVDRPFARRYSKRGFLLLPNVSFVLDLRKSMNEITRGMSRRRRRDLMKIKESNYTYALHRRSMQVFDFFYKKMYLPYITERFSQAAYIKTFVESKVVYCLNGGLVLVEEDKRPLAGILFQVQGKTLLACSLGLYEGKHELTRASEAALFYLISWAKTAGMEILDYGISMPLLGDGIFTYKKEWGMSVREPSVQSYCALKLNSLTEGSLALLRQNPFLVYDRGQIKGVIILDHNPDKAELQSLYARYNLPGLASIIFLSYYHDSEARSSCKVDSGTCGNRTYGLIESLQNICRLLQRQNYQTELTELKPKPSNSCTLEKGTRESENFLNCFSRKID